MAEPVNNAPRRESSTSVGLVVLGGLLAILGGVVAQEYQSRYAREQLAIQLRIREQENAVGALKEIGALADAPNVRALSVVEALLDNRADSTLRRLKVRFDEAVEAWNLGYNHSRVLAAVYFSDTLRIARINANIASGSRELLTLLQAHRSVRSRQAEIGRHHSVGDSMKLNPLTQMVRLEREATEAHRREIHDYQELFFDDQMVWATQIQSRRAGSFDPLGRYVLTPIEEERVIGKRDSLDSIASKAGGHH